MPLFWSLVLGSDTPRTAPRSPWHPFDVIGAIFRAVLPLVSGIVHGGGGDERDPPGGEFQVRPQTSRCTLPARDNGVLPAASDQRVRLAVDSGGGTGPGGPVPPPLTFSAPGHHRQILVTPDLQMFRAAAPPIAAPSGDVSAVTPPSARPSPRDQSQGRVWCLVGAGV